MASAGRRGSGTIVRMFEFVESLLTPAALLVIVTAAISGCRPAAPSGHAGAEIDLPDVAMTLPPAITPLPVTGMTNSDKVWLGQRLFEDRRLSADGTVACSSCHDVAQGGDDGRAVSIGVHGRRGSLNTPTVLNSRFNFAQFWDGRVRTLEEQILDTLRNPDTMGADLKQTVRTLSIDSQLADAFDRVYTDGLTTANMVDAMAAYVAALVTPGSAFDRFLAGDSSALDEEARAGYALFMRLGCVSCHQGRNIGGNLFQRFGVMGNYFADRGSVTPADYGRYNVTGRERDRYVFKVPSLRNVALTAPYFHDGSAETLEEAVRVMIQYQLGRPPESEQVEKLVAFLESLTGRLPASLQ